MRMGKLLKRKEDSTKRARVDHKKKRAEEQERRYRSVYTLCISLTHCVFQCALINSDCHGKLQCPPQESLGQKAENCTLLWSGRRGRARG